MITEVHASRYNGSPLNPSAVKFEGLQISQFLIGPASRAMPGYDVSRKEIFHIF